MLRPTFQKSLQVLNLEQNSAGIQQEENYDEEARRQRSDSHLLADEALEDLPASVHRSQLLGEVRLVAALSLHVVTAHLQHGLVDKVHRQLLAGQVDAKALREADET